MYPDDDIIPPDAKPLAPEHDPITDLIGKAIVDMTDEELAHHVAELRASVESPQSFRKLLKSHGDVDSKKPKAKAVKVDLSLLGL